MHSNQALIKWWRIAIGACLAVSSCLAQAATYANAATTFSWIDASSHNQVGAHSAPYQFRNLGGCGTNPPVIDDTISDQIPIGFNFTFGDQTFDSVRIMSNGRIQFTSTTIPWDNQTCGYGSPVTQIPIADPGLTYTMRIYGTDMDPTWASDAAPNGYVTACNDGTTAANNPCFISYATIGSAPNRQFVVTWNQVPEWASFSSATGSYNVQIIVKENGEFVYQYGTDIPGPQAATAQVAWEISTTDYDSVNVGYPVPNTAIRFFIPHPVVEYLMEQTSWSGAGKVLDTSGNGANGSAVGSAPPTPAAGGKVCNGASFTGAATQAIDTGLSVSSAIGNTGTIAFWYKSKNAWTSASTSDEELLDATTTTNQWFYLVRRGGGGANGGKLRFVITDSTGAAQIVETAAINVAANTWKHIAVTWSFNNYVGGNNDNLNIYVDGVLQQQTTFTSTTLTISSSIGTLYIGGTRSSLAGPGGTVNSTNGMIDEFRAYNYEATQATIASIMSLNAGGCLDHYAISDSGSGLSCQLSQVTVAAHTTSHSAYINNTLVTLSSSDGTGTWTLLTGHGTLTNIGTNTGSASYLFNGETQVLLGYTHPTANTTTFHVTDGTYAEQENTPLVVTNCVSGKFNACELAATRCTPTAVGTTYANLFTKLANTAFKLDLVALTTSGTLDAGFAKSVNVNLLANTTAPTINSSSNCPTSQTDTISLGTVTFTGGRAPAAGLSVAANAFSSAGKQYSAYRDVRVQFVCDATNCGANAGTYCATDGFTVRPQALTVTSSSNADATGTNASATPVVKAGASFTLTADTGTTAGYDGEPSIDVTKVAWAGAPSGVGSLSGSFSATASISTGNGASGSFTYSDVGYFQLQAGAVFDNAFAGVSGDIGNADCIVGLYANTVDSTGRYGCNVANIVATSYFGRFVPDHFTTAVTQGCASGSFTYSGQPFQVQVTASNAGNSTTQNYAGSYGKAVTFGSDGASTCTPTTTGFSNYTLAAGSFTAGIASTPPVTNTSAPLPISYTQAVNAPTAMNICATDSDGTSSHGQTQGTMSVRNGRIRMTNANGSELLALPLPTIIEYYASAAQGWQPNTLDSSCSTLSASNFAFSFPSDSANNLSACKTAVSISGPYPAPIVTLVKPGAGNTGWTDVTLNLGAIASGSQCAAVGGSGGAATTANLPWLQFNWSGSAGNPKARAMFGANRSSGPVIYRREMY